MNGLVTVIVPAYNRGKYIIQAVESVLNQTYKKIELIVIDDGSTDDTYGLLQEYSDRLTLLTHENRLNKGQSASINLGLKQAQGEFIAVLDSDDYWELNKLEIQVAYMNKNPDIGLLYTNGYGVSESGEIIYPYHKDNHVEMNDPNKVLVDCYLALPVNSLVRKKVYDEVGGFNETYRAAQDHDMLIRIAEKTNLAYLPDFLFYYRRHPQSISYQGTETRWRVGFKILKAAESRYPYKKQTIKKRKAVLNFRLAQCFYRQKKLISAVLCLLKSALLDPSRSARVLLKIEKNY